MPFPAPIPILTIIIDGRLPADRVYQLRLIAACNEAVAKQGEVRVEPGTTVQFVGTIPDGPAKPILERASRDAFLHGIAVYFLLNPKGIVRLQSIRPSRFARNIVTDISNAARHQLSGTRPGIVWTHIDYIDKTMFDSLAYSARRPSLFDQIANAVFNSAKRRHVMQLIFSGAPYLSKDDTYGRSAFESVIYNAPESKFGEPMLFGGGKTQRRSTASPALAANSE